MTGSISGSTGGFSSESGRSSPVCLAGSSLGGVMGVSTVSLRVMVFAAGGFSLLDEARAEVGGAE